MEVRFNICEKIFFLNTVTAKVEEAEVKRVQVVPTGISKDEQGKNVLDGFMVMYETVDGPVLADSEVFGSREEAVAGWKERISAL